MPMTYKHSGSRLPLVAGGTRTAGTIVADALVASGANSAHGIALSNASTGDTYWVDTRGAHNLTVPGATVAGALVYLPGSAGASAGTGPTVGNNLTLTTTSASNTLFGKLLTTADTNNKADVLILGIRY